MARCQDTDLCRNLFLIINNNSFQVSVIQDKIRYCGTKTELTAHLFNLMTHKLNDSHQLICAKMGFLLIKNLRRSPGFHKTRQNFLSSSESIFYKGIQFSVRKSSCSTFSELYIGIWVKNTVFPELLYCLLAFVSFLTTFQYKRTVTGLCKIPCTEQTSRAASDHYWWMKQFFRAWLRKMIADLFS